MGKLKFSVEYSFPNDRIRVQVGNAVGNWSIRFNGGSFIPFTPSGFYPFVDLNTPADGSYLIEYQDDNGIKKLCDFDVFPLSPTCTIRTYGFSHLLFNASGVNFLSSVPARNATGATFTANVLPFAFSVDGFATKKVGSSVDPNSSTCFPPVETNIPIGNYNVSYRFEGLMSCQTEFATDILNQDILSPLAASFSKTDVTSNGGSDGSIVVSASGGSGSYSYSWADSAVTTATRTGLTLGEYICEITDLVTAETVELTIFINEPAPEPVPDVTPYLEVPSMQSLHFAIENSTDNCSIFETLDNRLFSNQFHPQFIGLSYDQKKCLCDFFNIQVRSNTQNLLIQLHDSCDDSVKDTYNASLILEGLEQVEEYTVRLQDNGSQQTRVYFTGSSVFPFPISEGDSFSLFNSPFGNGDYEVVLLNIDITTGQQYFVINLDYAAESSNPSETADVRFVLDNLPFNIYEFTVDFSAMFIGNYYIKITASNLDESQQVIAKSEPIDLRESHEYTKLIEWANIDNSYDIDYSNNIVHRIRLNTIMFNRMPTAEKEGFRALDGSYVLLSAQPQRKLKANFFNVPPYIHEKLSIILDSDIKRINGMSFTCEEGLEEPEYIEKFGLSSSGAMLEFKWFSTYNKNNIGGINTPSQAFIDTQLGLIKR